MRRLLLISLSACLALLASAAAPASETTETAPLRVFASVLPVETFVAEVGGDRVETRVMVRPGHSPATYDPTPQQVAALANADLYVRVGVPFEAAWMKRIRAANPEMPILDLREAVELRPQQAHDHETDPQHGHAPEHHGDEALDPHIWTSPRNAIRMTAAIRDALSALAPAGASGYAARQRAYAETLAALDAELEETLAGLEHRSFLVYHPAWGYFAEAYGLEQIPIEAAGKEPGPKRLTALIEQARAAGSRVIFVQPQFDRRAAAQVAKAIGGRVETVDPLAAEYADSLRRFARIIAEANAPASAARRPEPAE